MQYKIFIQLENKTLNYTVDAYSRENGFIKFFDKVTNKTILFNEMFVIQIQEVV
jgi:hypothetical protein